MLFRSGDPPVQHGNPRFELSGDYTHYTADRLDITIYGDKIGISLTDKKVYIGETPHRKVYSFDGNELMQESNYYKGVSNQNAIEHAFLKTLAQYENGKETATLLCSISDYYDEYGNKALSTKGDAKMSFDIGDLVIPMICNEKREDVPMSYYTDGRPKVFRVVGVKMIYDGAVWQELTLQEYTE